MKKITRFILVFSILLLLSPAKVFAEEYYLDFLANSYLDEGLKQEDGNTQEKTKLFFRLPINDKAVHQFRYNLKDGEESVVQYEEKADGLEIKYWIETNSAGAKMDLSTAGTYARMDYDSTPRQWVNETLPADTKELIYMIKNKITDGQELPGMMMSIGIRQVAIAWEKNEKNLIIQVGDLEKGNIMPASLWVEGVEKKKIHVIKAFNEFITRPTHYENVGGVDTDINPFKEPSTKPAEYSDAGSRPGISISFKEPKQWDTENMKYVYVSDPLSGENSIFNFEDVKARFSIVETVNKGRNSQFDISLSHTDGGAINDISQESPEHENQTANYKYTDHTYTIELVKNKYGRIKNGVNDGTGLVNQEKYVEWTGLDYSDTYNMQITLEADDKTKYEDYKLPYIIPESRLTYTYLRYDVERISENDGFLKIYPYFLKDGDTPETVVYTVLNRLGGENNTTLTGGIGNEWLSTTYTSRKKDEVFYIPIKLNSTFTKNEYQIKMKYLEGSDILSQVVDYDTDKDNDYPVSSTKIKEISEKRIFSFDDETKAYPLKAQFDMVFKAPRNSGEYDELRKVFERLIESGYAEADAKIYYELYINDIPEEIEGNKFELIKVFSVSREEVPPAGSKIYKYSLEDVTPQEAPPAQIAHADASNDGGFENGYRAGADLFKMDNIIIADNTKKADNGFVKVVEYDGQGNYTLSANGAQIADDSINFLRLKAVTYPKTQEAGATVIKRKESDNSMPYSLSLSDSGIDVPIVEKFKYQPYYEKINGEEVLQGGSIRIDFNLSKTRKELYEQNMLTPLNKKIVNRKFRLYLTGDKSLLNENLDDASLDKLEVVAGDNLSILNGGDIHIDVKEADVKKILGDENIAPKVLYHDFDITGNNPDEVHLFLKKLRERAVIYTTVKTILQVEDKDDNTIKEDKESKLSKTLEITIPSNVENPDEEKIPLAPDNFTVTFNDEARTNAKLNFFVPKGFRFKPEGVGFEIISIKGNALGEVSRTETLDNILDKYDKDKAEGIRVHLDKNGNLVFQRKVKGQAPVDIDPELFDFKNVEGEITIIDDNNTPNQLYYYYVRTVSIDEDSNDLGRSNFVSATLTTDNLKAPRDLKVNLEFDKFPINEKNEMLIEFEAPVPNKTDVPSKYDFEIWVKMDDGDYKKVPYTEGKRIVTATKMATRDSSYKGYNKFIYKLSGLKSGKTYSIKLRVMDKTNPMETPPEGLSPQYPMSAFSNILIARTEFDQDDYDKEQKYKKYLDYFEKKSKELLKKEYYILDESKDEIEVYYKIDYLYNLKNGNKLTLHSFDKESTTYYLPSDYIEEIKANNLQIELRSLGNSVFIKGDAIKSAIMDAEEDIRNGNKKGYEDYLIGFVLDTDKRKKKINGKDLNSEVVSVEYVNVLYDKVMPQLEGVFKEDFNKAIVLEKPRIVSELENQSTLDDETFLEIALDHVDDLSYEFMLSIAKSFDNGIRREDDYDDFDEKVSYSLSRNDDDYASLMYERKKKSYVATDADFFANKYVHDGKDTHRYVLLISDGSPVEVDEHQTTTYYDLDEVFSDKELNDDNANTTKDKFLRAVGNILGKDSKAIARAYGVSLSNMDKALSNEDAYYVFLKAYSQAKNIDVDSATVYDYYIAEDINEVKEKYKRYILKGLNLGLVDTGDGYIRPKESTKMKKVKELLIKLHKGVK